MQRHTVYPRSLDPINIATYYNFVKTSCTDSKLLLLPTKDSLSVGDNDGPDVGLRPVLQHVVHVALVVDGDEQALHIQKESEYV